jgi:hypothetical protein
MRDEDGFQAETDDTQNRKPVSMRVVDEIAEAYGCDPIDLEPLAASIDPDALDNVVGSATETTVTFDHAGCAVEVEVSVTDVAVTVRRKIGV